MSDAETTWTYRTLFISDLHLGSRYCSVGPLVHFLAHRSAGTLFLVGDIIDFWCIGRRAAWSSEQGELLWRLCRMTEDGTRVILIPGNHDDHLRDFLDVPLKGLEIHRDFVHETATCQRFLVLHGDEHDIVVRRSAPLTYVANAWKERAAGLIRPLLCRLAANGAADRNMAAAWSLMRRHAGGVARLEAELVAEARRRQLQGVICGHTHLAADAVFDGIRYMNCGNWVGSSTAIVESWSGHMELIRWEGWPVPLRTCHGVENSAPVAGTIAAANVAPEVS